MNLSKFIIISLLALFMVRCQNSDFHKQTELSQPQIDYSVDVKNFRTNQIYKVSYKIDSTYTQVRPMNWGVLLNKKYKDDDRSVSISFVYLTDSVDYKSDNYKRALLIERKFAFKYVNSEYQMVNRFENNVEGLITRIECDSTSYVSFSGCHLPSKIFFEITCYSPKTNEMIYRILKSFKFTPT